MPDVIVRQAHSADISALVELNRAAYPVLAEDNCVWSRFHLESHQRVFPEGQIVAELDGRIVGAAASLVVDLGPNPLRHHTWAGITDSGYFTNHNSQADTLYGADVCTHPDVRGLGVGAALFRAVQQIPAGDAAGLNGYLYGKAASLVASDVWLFAVAAAVVLAVVVALHKELVLVCFDPEFAAATGLPVKSLDLLLTGLAVAVTVLGLQSVGLVLAVATLTIPPAAARFWTDRAGVMTALAATFGAAAAIAGVILSALVPKLAAGATIVLAAGVLFALSLVFGPRGGLLSRRSPFASETTEGAV